MEQSRTPDQAEAVSKRGLPRGLLSLARRGLIFMAVTFVGFFAVLFTAQDRIIFPGAATQGTPQARIEGRPGTELLSLKNEKGQRITALYGPALNANNSPMADASERPALIFFYGNAMCLAYSEPEFERFRRLGLNVIVPDYLGYGMSEGKPSERGCRETAEACYEFLIARGFKPDKIIVCGWSLGGAVAIDLASRHEVGGLIAFSTFTSTKAMARSLMPVPIPGFLFAHKFDSLRKIGSIQCPMLLGHGRRDSIVSFSMHEQLVKAAKQARVTTIVIDDADHNDFFDTGGGRIDAAMRRFVDSLGE